MAPAVPIITLTTDFGTRDHFVGSMKGVILSINPRATIVDIAHDLPPHDVEAAAFQIGYAYRDFPRRSIHVVVVDPGVGGPRRPILGVTDWGYFLAPDNGVLTRVYGGSGTAQVIHLTTAQYFKVSPGRTFHGRDIFAPAAAWLTRGVEPMTFGDTIQDPVRLDLPEPTVEKKRLIGRVAYVDRFGNLITNITAAHLQALAACRPVRWQIRVRQAVIEGLSEYYAERPAGEPQAVINSSGLLEIACYRASAETRLSASRGAEVTVALM